MPLARYVAMMERAAARSGDTHFGLRFGQQFQPEALGLIGQLALAAPDVGTGLAAFARHFIEHQQNTETRLAREGRSLRLEYRIVDPRIWSRRQDAELTMGMFANLLRARARRRAGDRGGLVRAPGAGTGAGACGGVRRAGVLAAPANAISFRAAGLDRPMPARDPARFAAWPRSCAGSAAAARRATCSAR